jgi:hypothetical protein
MADRHEIGKEDTQQNQGGVIYTIPGGGLSFDPDKLGVGEAARNEAARGNGTITPQTLPQSEGR